MISKDKELRLLKYNFPDSLGYEETSGKYVTETPKYAVANITYNVEQDNYMWYLRGNLVLPDVRLAQMVQSEDKSSAAKKKKGKKEGGFFKNLFKRKNKSAVDSAAIQPAPSQKDEFDFVDENEPSVTPTAGQEEPQQKKGLFSRKKKDKATQAEVGAAQEPAPAEEKPAKRKKEKAKAEEAKPEEEPKQDDGF